MLIKSVFNNNLIAKMSILSLLSLGACARSEGYPAPAGSSIVVTPESVTTSWGGFVTLVDGAVYDVEGNLLNNIQVTAQSGYAGVVLVPETAISAVVSGEDTTPNWETDAQKYYDIVSVDTSISPDYMETKTDSYGRMRLFAYVRCLPTDCNIDTCSIDEIMSDPNNSIDYYTECTPSGAQIFFSIGVASTVLDIAVESSSSE